MQTSRIAMLFCTLLGVFYTSWAIVCPESSSAISDLGRPLNLTDVGRGGGNRIVDLAYAILGIFREPGGLSFPRNHPPRNRLADAHGGRRKRETEIPT